MFPGVIFRRAKIIKPIVFYRSSQRKTQPYVMTLNEAGTESLFRAFIFNYNAYDRTNNICFPTISRYFEWSGINTATHPKFILAPLKLYRSDLHLFFTVSDYNISQKMFELARNCLNQKTNVAAVLKTRFVASGKSSLSFLGSIINESDEKVLATMHFKATLFNVKTRKRYILPEATQQVLAPHTDHSMDNNLFEPSAKPDAAFQYNTIIRPSDADHNGHTGHTTYIRLCFDAATTAGLRGGIFKSFSGDILLYQVKRARMWFNKESGVGDSLSVFAWENLADKLSINFQINKGDKAIYYAVFYFHPKQ